MHTTNCARSITSSDDLLTGSGETGSEMMRPVSPCWDVTMPCPLHQAIPLVSGQQSHKHFAPVTMDKYDSPFISLSRAWYHVSLCSVVSIPAGYSAGSGAALRMLCSSLRM